MEVINPPPLISGKPVIPGTLYVRLGCSSGKAQTVGGSRARWNPESGKLGSEITGPVGKPARKITGPVENRSGK